MKAPDFRKLLSTALTSTASSREVSKTLFGTDTRKTTIQAYRNRARALKVSWSDLHNLPTSELRKKFLKRGGHHGAGTVDWEAVAREMRHPGMTLQVVWEELRAVAGDTPSYSRFTHLYREHRKNNRVVMRQIHEPGEKAYVDFAGTRPWYYEGDVRVEVELAVITLGYSRYSTARCVSSQSVPDWLSIFPKAFEEFGGVPKILVPDNLAAAVTRPRPDTIIQRNFLESAEHYGFAVQPAEPRSPQQKATVERHVNLVGQAFLPWLRKHRCTSLDELNALLAACMARFNAKPLRDFSGQTRLSRLLDQERPALQPLPEKPFVYRDWLRPRQVPADYHLRVHGHFYSVPHDWVGKTVEVCVMADSVEFLYDGVDVVRHVLSTVQGGVTTLREHLPETHRAQADRTPEKLLAWAESIGPSMLALIKKQFDRKVPLQGFQHADAMRSAVRSLTPVEAERVAQRALELGTPNLTGLRRVMAVGAVLTLALRPPPLSDDRRRKRPAPTRRPAGAPAEPAPVVFRRKGKRP